MHPLLILLCTCFASNKLLVGSKARAKGGEQLRGTLIGDRDRDASHGHGHGHVPQQGAKDGRSRKPSAQNNAKIPNN